MVHLKTKAAGVKAEKKGITVTFESATEGAKPDLESGTWDRVLVAVGRTPNGGKIAADKAGVTIISINALYPFNVWGGDLPARAEAMADYANACGARALVMCPLNDGSPVAFDDLVAALTGQAPHRLPPWLKE